MFFDHKSSFPSPRRLCSGRSSELGVTFTLDGEISGGSRLSAMTIGVDGGGRAASAELSMIEDRGSARARDRHVKGFDELAC